VTPNHTDPALKFNDGLYEAYNSAAGSVISGFGNLFQLQLNFAWTTARHAVKWGTEARLNRDTTYFGISPRTGNTILAAERFIRPFSSLLRVDGTNVQPGQPLPDTLSSLLLGFRTPTRSRWRRPTHRMARTLGPAAINRNDVNAYIEDTWKINPEWTLQYGLRYELYHADFGAGAPNVELSEFVPTCGRWAGILDQSAAYLSKPIGTVGGRVFRWTGTRPTRCMCTWAGRSL